METISKKFINPVEDKISQINHDIKYWIKTNIPFKKIAIMQSKFLQSRLAQYFFVK